jgi:predicted DNA-binding transcriptional regulator AlpA
MRDQTISAREQQRRAQQRLKPKHRTARPPDDEPTLVVDDEVIAGRSAGARARALDQQPPPLRRRSPHDAITLVRKVEIARALGVAPVTIDRWVSANRFPRPVYTSDLAPARWLLRDIKAWIAKRQNARRPKPPRQGTLRRGGQ